MLRRRRARNAAVARSPARGGNQRGPLFDVSKIEELGLLDETFDVPGPDYKRDDTAMVTIYNQL